MILIISHMTPPFILLSHRRGDGGRPLTYHFPSGPLTKLLLAHIKEGHRLITQCTGTEPPQLFISSAGNPFTDATFTQYWTQIMSSSTARGQRPFPPSLARTMFIEEFTKIHGEMPDLWDGCSHVMGNSVNQWNKHYRISKKDRGAAAAITAHTEARSRHDDKEVEEKGGREEEEGKREEDGTEGWGGREYSST